MAPARATRCSSTASIRAIRKAARPGRSTTTTWLRSTSSRASARRPNTAATPARWSTRSPSRAATASPGCSTIFGHELRRLGSNNISARSPRRTRALADPATTKKYADITTQFGGPIEHNKLFFFVSAQRFLLETDPSGPVTTASRGQPAAQRQAHVAAEREQPVHRPCPVRRLQHHGPRRLQFIDNRCATVNAKTRRNTCG